MNFKQPVLRATETVCSPPDRIREDGSVYTAQLCPSVMIAALLVSVLKYLMKNNLGKEVFILATIQGYDHHGVRVMEAGA